MDSLKYCKCVAKYSQDNNVDADADADAVRILLLERFLGYAIIFLRWHGQSMKTLHIFS